MKVFRETRSRKKRRQQPPTVVCRRGFQNRIRNRHVVREKRPQNTRHRVTVAFSHGLHKILPKSYKFTVRLGITIVHPADEDLPNFLIVNRHAVRVEQRQGLHDGQVPDMKKPRPRR